MSDTPKNDGKNETKPNSRGKRKPDSVCLSLSGIYSAPISCQGLPSQMIVAIDGWAQSGKNTTGELVAEAIGGVLVDSGRFYRAFTKAYLDSDGDLEDSQWILKFCRDASFEIHLAKEGGKVSEAQVGVNGKFYSKTQLNHLGEATSKIARIREVRDLVNNGLRLCQRYGKVVMLGRDIGGAVFPKTPYKFFLDASEKIREQRHLNTTHGTGAAKRDRNDINQVVFAEDALLIDTGDHQPESVKGIILVDIFWRTEELKELQKQNPGVQ